MSERHGERSARPATEPAPTITEHARTDSWTDLNTHTHTPQQTAGRGTPASDD